MVAIVPLSQEQGQDRWLTPEEVANRLNLSPMTVYRRIRDKELPARRDGKRLLRIRESDLQAYITRTTINPDQ